MKHAHNREGSISPLPSTYKHTPAVSTHRTAFRNHECMQHVIRFPVNVLPLMIPYRRGHFKFRPAYVCSRYSLVGIATGYGLDGPGSISGSARLISSTQRTDRLWAHPASHSTVFGG
jgi:hypothetical protein